MCNKCNKWFPSTTEYFYKNKDNGIDGLFPYCKKCNMEKSAQWAKDNPERRKELKCNFDSKPDSKKRRRKYNKMRVKNGEYKKWIINNPDKLKEYMSKHQNHDITDTEWDSCLKYFNYSCAYCGMHQYDAKEKYDNYLHKEHVIHDGANDLSNCIPACKSCNSLKWQYKIEDWYNDQNKIFDENRYNKIIKWINEDYKEFIDNEM